MQVSIDEKESNYFNYTFNIINNYFITKKIIFSKLQIKKIYIENNVIIDENDIKNLLTPILNKNIIFIDNTEIERILNTHSFIESFYIKKNYPDSLVIKIFEKKPIAILLNKKGKFYLSEKIELIEFRKIDNFEDLPYIFGNLDQFKIFYNNLKKVNFPFELVLNYKLFKSNRWDIETKNGKNFKTSI